MRTWIVCAVLFYLGAPIIKGVAGHGNVKRVVNTHALILQHGASPDFYLHVFDGWLSASAASGAVRKVCSGDQPASLPAW